MDIHHLRIFQTVCRTGSMTKAAEVLNTTQPAVSLSISELENFYQVRVFDRAGRKLRLTEPGKYLLTYTDSMLAQYDEAAASLREGTYFHACTIGLNVSTGETEAQKIINDIKEEISEIDLHLIINNSSEIMRLVKNDEIDLAIVDEIEDETTFHIHLWKEEKMIPLVSSSLIQKKAQNTIGMTREELIKLPLLLREKGSGNRRCIDSYFHEKNLVPFMESASELSLINGAQAGLGVVFLPASLVSQIRNRKTLVEIELTDKLPVRSYYLIWRRNRYQTKTVQKVIEILQKQA